MKYEKTIFCFTVAIAAIVFSWKSCDCVFENIIQTFETESSTQDRMDAKFSDAVWKAKDEKRNCRPQFALSKEELFELAMEDYFQILITGIWDDDLDTQEFYPLYYRPTFYKNICGLERDACGKPIRMSQQVCYPHKISHYRTLESLTQRLIEVGDTADYQELLTPILSATPYKPNENIPIYRGEFYNQDTDFSVIYSKTGAVRFYAQDCCRLLSYEEAVEDYENFRQSGMKKLDILKPSEKYGDKYHFLRVAYYVLYFYDDMESRYTNDFINRDKSILAFMKEKQSLDVTYYPVSDCGKIFYYCSDCIRTVIKED